MNKILFLIIGLLIVPEMTIWFYLIPTVEANALKRDTQIFRTLGDQYFGLKDKVEDMEVQVNTLKNKKRYR